MSEQAEFHEHPLAQRFFVLTPDKVMDAVEAVVGGRCTGSFSVLNSYENRVYLLPMTDGREIVGKFYRPGRWNTDQIYDEHEFTADLLDAGVPVAVPLILKDGDTIGEVEGIFFALYDRVLGRVPQELSIDELDELGIGLARLHEVGEDFDELHRPPLTIHNYARQNLAYLLDNNILPPDMQRAYAQAVESLIAHCEPLFADLPTHRIHGDCHLGNLIRSSRGLVFLDFDDMLIGPAVQDIWLLAPSYDQDGQEQRERIVRSYNTERFFDPDWLSLVEPLRALRFIRFATWIARRRQDPFFLRAFPYFFEERYWRDQITDLHEQIQRITQGFV